MNALLGPLSAELRVIVLAVRFEGLTEREIAQRLGITRHQVRTSYAQALALLRPHFQAIVADSEGI